MARGVPSQLRLWSRAICYALLICGASTCVAEEKSGKAEKPIWEQSRHDFPILLKQPYPKGWNWGHHSLATDYEISISADGSINVVLSNLHPKEGVPVDQAVGPDSITDTGSDKPQPTPMQYRWRNCEIQPFIKKLTVEQSVIGGQIKSTWVDCDIGVKLVGTARELRSADLEPTVHGSDFGPHHVVVPLYGPDFEISVELHFNLHTVLSKDVPALNQIPKAKFHAGTQAKVSYSSEREGGTEDSRDEEFPIRTFLHEKIGMVRVKRAGGDWVKAEDNMDLNIGDMVKTLGNGKAQVVLAGTAVIRVKPDSEFIIPENKANSKEKVSFLQMLKGTLWAKAKKEDDSLKVATPNAICGGREAIDPSVPHTMNWWEMEVQYREQMAQQQAEQEKTTCVYCYSAKIAVWPPVERDGEGEPLAELLPTESICIGPRGVIEPAPPAAGDLPTELTVELSSKDRTPTVRVAPGATIKVKVATYAGTGYQMTMVPIERGGLTQTAGPVDEAMKRPAGKVDVGAGTWKVYDFKVPEKARGKFPVKFQFSRGRGKMEVEYTLTVEVGG